MPKHQALTAAGEHISIVAHIATEELRRRLTQDSMANGFANRFLFVYTQRIRELPEGGDLQIENLQPEADGPCAAFVSKLKALRERKIRRLSGRKGGWGSRSARFRSMPNAVYRSGVPDDECLSDGCENLLDAIEFDDGSVLARRGVFLRPSIQYNVDAYFKAVCFPFLFCTAVSLILMAVVAARDTAAACASSPARIPLGH
jgi:hypothetical protein